jgi:hypothetical protein
MTEAQMIEEYIATRGVTRCPTMFVAASRQLASDKIEIKPIFEAGETKSQTLARLYKQGNSCQFLAHLFDTNPQRVAQLIRNEGVVVAKYSAKRARENWVARGGGW